MKKIKIVFASLAICGMLAVNYSASGFQTGKTGTIGGGGGGGGEITCFSTYDIVGTTVFTKCIGCKETTGSEPAVASTCTP